MTNPYDMNTPSISGYNATPPSDDGTVSESNKVKWSNHINKIGDPLKAYADAISDQVSVAFSQTWPHNGVISISVTTAINTADRGSHYSVTGTTTLDLMAAASATEGFCFSVRNDGVATVTIDPSGAETINGAATLTLSPSEFAIVICTGSAWLALKGITAASIPAASETVPGIIEIATQVEADAGTDDARAITPLKLNNWSGFASKIPQATETVQGKIELATQAEVNTGTDTERAVTPATLKNSNFVKGAIFVETKAATGSSADFTAFAAYNAAKVTFILRDVVMTTNNIKLLMRTSTDGGSTYSSAASDYGFTYKSRKTSDSTEASADGPGTSINLLPDTANTSTPKINGFVEMYNPSSSTSEKFVRWSLFAYVNGGVVGVAITEGHGYRDATTDIDGIRFLPESSTFSSGNIDCYVSDN